MEENLKQSLSKAQNEIEAADSLEVLEKIRVSYLGKKGIITDLKKNISKLPNEEKPMAGKLINETSTKIENALLEKSEILKEELLKDMIVGIWL